MSVLEVVNCGHTDCFSIELVPPVNDPLRKEMSSQIAIHFRYLTSRDDVLFGYPCSGRRRRSRWLLQATFHDAVDFKAGAVERGRGRTDVEAESTTAR